MNVKKISIGLLFLILALVVVPGVSALSSYKGNHPHPVTAEQAVNCKACHVNNGAPLDLQTCSRCHPDPYPPTATPTVTTTSAGTTTPTAMATPVVTTTLIATPQLTPNMTKEIPDEEETQEETETQEERETPAVTAAGTPTTPGFGIVSAIVGLFVLFLVKRNNK